jgi:hypothetical protein
MPSFTRQAVKVREVIGQASSHGLVVDSVEGKR